MSRIRADKLVNRAGSGGPQFPYGVANGLTVSGIVTATSFSGNVTGNVTGNADTATSATTATTQATNASTSATNAATSETNAATSETNAATSATNAATSETLAEEWAEKTTGIVDSTGYSSKAWATGGTGVTNQSGGGASEEWATKTTATVDGTEYSAKEYAIGAQTANTSGSAKQWAIGGGASFDINTAVEGTNYSAKYYAELAASTLDSFDDVYLGGKSSAPSVDNDGDPLTAGDLYFDTTTSKLRYYDGSAWNNVEAVDTSSFATAGFSIAMSVAL